jgi:hypothetical protein
MSILKNKDLWIMDRCEKALNSYCNSTNKYIFIIDIFSKILCIQINVTLLCWKANCRLYVHEYCFHFFKLQELSPIFCHCIYACSIYVCEFFFINFFKIQELSLISSPITTDLCAHNIHGTFITPKF